MKIFSEMKNPYIKNGKKTLHKGETWLKGYEGLYYVNTKGEIWSYLSFKKPNMLMKHQILNSGYPIFTPSDKFHKRKTQLIGRLILSTFVDLPEKGMIVSYRDNNKLNVAPSNLYWAPLSTRQHKRAEHIDLIKDGKTISFIGIDKARIFLKAGWGWMLREAAESGTLIKEYKVIIHPKEKTLIEIEPIIGIDGAKWKTFKLKINNYE